MTNYNIFQIIVGVVIGINLIISYLFASAKNIEYELVHLFIALILAVVLL